MVMKRLIVFIILALLLCGINFGAVQNLTLEQIFQTAQVEVYTSEQTNLQYQKTTNGAGEIIYCNLAQLNYILNNCACVSGYTLKINNLQIKDVLLKLNARQITQNNYGAYGWSRLLSYKINKQITIDNQAVNFQCVQSKSSVLLGVPILLGSY